MTGQYESWFHRHLRTLLASTAAMLVLAVGYLLVSAVQQARTAAIRSADL